MSGQDCRLAVATLVASAALVATCSHASAPDPDARFGAGAATTGFEARSDAPPGPGTVARGSAFAIASPGLDWTGTSSARSHSISSTERGGALPVLSAERAQILLRSLTVPGWGQATLGRNGAAKTFILVEAGIWASFVAFHIQEAMRRDSYERSARLNAGIDLRDRGEEFRRIVGGFLSSDDYNLLVVYRDAANLYYDDPVQYRAYIAEHELKGADTWNWASLDDLLQYRAQRKDSQRAHQRSNTAMAMAVVNRFVSALHAARVAGRPATGHRSWNLEAAPATDGGDLALRCGVRAWF